jgi:hypothetical protein
MIMIKIIWLTFNPIAFQRGKMSYSDEIGMNPQNPSTIPAEAEDETIIDLIEEIDEPSLPSALSPLERRLLNIEDETPAAAEPTRERSDLENLDFEEEADQPRQDLSALDSAVGAANSSSPEEDMDWLFGPGADARSEEIERSLDDSAMQSEELREFQKNALEAEDIVKAAAPPAKAIDPGNEDEDIELLEIEGDEVDDEIVWFDELDKEPASAEVKPEAEADAAPLFNLDPDLLSDSSAADIFSAHVESGLMAGETAIPAAPLLAAAVPAAAPPSSLSSHHPLELSPSETRIPTGTAELSAEEIDAAVERVLERKLGGTLQSIIRQAIEAAVSKEIQRLKALLLEEDAGDRMA